MLFIQWKSRVVRGGLRRARLGRWVSLLAALALLTLIAGFGSATGLVRSIAGKPALWVHIAFALATGVSIDEIKKTLIHVTVYCGTPAGRQAFWAAHAAFLAEGALDCPA